MVGGAVTLSRTAGQSLLPFAQWGETSGRADRRIWEGTPQREGSKGYDPWQGEATGGGGKNFVLVDIFWKGREQLWLNYLGTCPWH